jgi:hypothetical protein
MRLFCGILIIWVSLLLLPERGWGQANPVPFDLSTGNFSFTGFSDGAITIYPIHMQGHSFSSERTTANLSDPASADRVLAASTTGITTGSIRNEVGNGISLLNSGSNNIGAIVVAINTMGNSNVSVTFTAEQLNSGGSGETDRINGLRLQYRVGTTGGFTDIPVTEYLTTNTTEQNPPQTFSNITLPAVCNNQEVVQLRWIYYISSGTANGRDRIRLDNIFITSDLANNLLALYNFQDIVSASNVAHNVSASDVTISAGSIAFQNGADDGGTRIGNSGNWSENDFNPTGKYLEFTISSELGYQIDYSQITLRFGRTAAGPERVTAQYSLDGFATDGINIIDNEIVSSTAANSLDPFTIPVSSLPPGPQTSPITIRIWGHNASGTGNFRFNNFRVFGIVTEDPNYVNIATGNVLGSPFNLVNCNSTISGGTVSYNIITGTLNPENTFTAELSDHTGSFSHPLAIGILNSQTSGDISITIPENIITSDQYRVRIVSSDPPNTGSISDSFTINREEGFCPQIGDFRTQSSGTWNTASTWQIYEYNSATKTRSWENATEQPNHASANVFIRNGHTIDLTIGPRNLNNLIIEPGGQLRRNNEGCNLTYLSLSGSIINNGSLGNNGISDALGINIQAGNHVISGTGTTDIWRIRLSDQYNNDAVIGSASLLIEKDITLRYNPDICSDAFGTNAIYNNRAGTETFDVEISAGNSLILNSPSASAGMDGPNSSTGYPTTNRGGGYSVYGTIEIAGHYMAGSNNPEEQRPYLRIRDGGVFKVGFIDFGDNNENHGGELTLQSGATLEITGADGSGDTWVNTNVGSIIFNVNSDATVIYSGNVNQNLAALFDYPELQLTDSGTKFFPNTPITALGDVLFDGTTIQGNGPGSALHAAANINLLNTVDFNFWYLNFQTIGDGDQMITTGDNVFEVFNFNSAKNTGSLILPAGNSNVRARNNLRLNFSGSSVFHDNSNTFLYGNDLSIQGGTSNYSLTGTLHLLSSEGDNDFEFIDVPLNNLTIETSGSAHPRFRHSLDFNQNINIEGDFNYFSTSDQALFLSDVELFIAGNMNIDATADRWDRGSSRIAFNGNTLQNFQSSESLQLQNMTMNNNSGLNINNNITVVENLTMQDGNINMDGNILQIGISHESTSSLTHVSGQIVDGWLKRWFDSSVNTAEEGFFPVGLENSLNNATVEFTTPPLTTGSLRARFYPGLPENEYHGLPFTRDGINFNTIGEYGYWEILPETEGGLSGGVYTLSLNADGFDGIEEPSLIRILKREDQDDAWDLDGVFEFAAQVDNIFVHSGMSGLSEFVISGNILQNPLPIELIHFSAEAIGIEVELTWATASEINNDFFTLERTTNMRDIEIIGRKPGAGNSNTVLRYSYTDRDPHPGHQLLPPEANRLRWHFRIQRLGCGKGKSGCRKWTGNSQAFPAGRFCINAAANTTALQSSDYGYRYLRSGSSPRAFTFTASETARYSFVPNTSGLIFITISDGQSRVSGRIVIR